MSNWTLNINTPAQPNNWDSISYGTPGGTGIFVAVANSGTIRVMTSLDGTTWSNTGISGNLIASGNFNSVTYGTPGGTGTFIAVAPPRSVMYSNDGKTWIGNTGASQTAGFWASVTYGTPGGTGTFTSVSNSGPATNRVMYSVNAGITWIQGPSANDSIAWNTVAYGNPGGTGTFVAVSSNLTVLTAQVMTSYDGASWTIRQSAGVAPWYATTYGTPGGVGTFVAIANGGVGSQTMYSLDGITWNLGTAAFTNQSWRSVTYGTQGGIGTFVAVSNAGANLGNQSMSSIDGITWVLDTTPNPTPSVNWVAVASGTPSGNPVFAAVGANNSMVSCFLENTQILIKQYGDEIYIPIQNLRKGDLVKTLNYGYIQIHSVGHAILYNDSLNKNVTQKLYCKKTGFDDLILTGGHSILVDSLNEDEIIKTNKYWDVPKMIDDKYLLLVCIDKNAELYEKNGLMNIYHVALECENIHRNFGIYANGILVESCSIDYLAKTMR